MYVFFPGQVQEIEAEQIYQISIHLKRGNINLQLSIEIHQGFPNVPPTISVSPPISHQWVNSTMQITEHRQLTSWTGAFLLGNIIKDIELEFALRIPQLLSSSSLPKSYFQNQNHSPSEDKSILQK